MMAVALGDPAEKFLQPEQTQSACRDSLPLVVVNRSPDAADEIRQPG